jgi:ABC-type dipeptide/oligopeptide/nickel transport system permease subunit
MILPAGFSILILITLFNLLGERLKSKYSITEKFGEEHFIAKN